LKTDVYYQFFVNSPFAYSCHRVIAGENGRPVDYVFLEYNQAFEQLMGLEGKEIHHQRLFDIFPFLLDKEEWKENLAQAVFNRKPLKIDIKHHSTQQWTRMNVFQLEPDIYGCIYTDVTKEYKQDKEIESFLRINIDLVFITDMTGSLVRVNHAVEKILGYQAEEIEGVSFKSLLHHEDIQKTIDVRKELENHDTVANYINRVRHKNGTYRYIEWNSQSNGKYIYSSARDITERKKLEEELCEKNHSLGLLTEELKQKNKLLNKLAVTDELTGLYNRQFIVQQIKPLIKKADIEKYALSMILVDIDFFKNINDTWGHPVGDSVLKQTGQLMKQTLRQSDTLIRLGGEEFIIVLPYTSLDAASKIAERIRINIERFNYPSAGNVTASFGVAKKMMNESFESWYSRADIALYKAKESKRNCVVKANL